MCQMTQKVSIEKIEHKAPEFLIRGEYFDRSKFGRYGVRYSKFSGPEGFDHIKAAAKEKGFYRCG